MVRYSSPLTVLVVALIMVQPAVSLAQWVKNGVPICTAASDQEDPQLVSDGAGGAIITWEDNRSGNFDIYAQRIDANGDTLWVKDGVAICTATGDQEYPRLDSDGAGGAIIAWRDERSGNFDIYAQRIDANGNVLWTADGVAICTATNDQYYLEVVSDGTGGAIITWDDMRNGINKDIYVQRVDAAGTTQWTANGVAICTRTMDQHMPQLISDEAGGAIITWYDYRSGGLPDIYAQRVDAAGTTQWTANGVAICTASGHQYEQNLVSDGAGGAIIAWRDERSGNFDIYAQRIDANGNVLWTADGVAICTATGDQQRPQITSDGTGGAITTWLDYRSGPYGIYAQRVDSSGPVWWTTNGVAICTDPGLGWLFSYPQLISDGSGGAIITWPNLRGIIDHDWNIYAQKVNSLGTVQWTTSGVPICTAHGGQYDPQLVSDGAGGAVITWDNADIYAQRVGPEGQPGGWSIITNIEDVPHDQGGRITLRWTRSGLDASSLPVITHYSIWRSLPSGKLASLEANVTKEVSPAQVGPDFSGSAYRVTTKRGSDFYWEWIANQPAHYFSNYSYTAATLFDSTSAMDGWHYFLVSAHTSDPFLFWDSEPDSGYSLDNLAPAVPKGLTAVISDSTMLTWLSNTEPDLAYYAIYRGPCPDFMPDTPLAYTTDTTYTDLATEYCYMVSAFDFAGNESPLAGPVSVRDDEALPELPKDFSLSQNCPNPFNPMTEISYALPKPCQVKLDLYNLLGQRVATLVDSYQPAGYRTVRWNGGHLASGVYLYRIEAGSFREVRRMILLK